MKKNFLIIVIISVIFLIFNNFALINQVILHKKGMTPLYKNYINSQDTYTYVSLIEQSRQGQFLFEDLYYPIDQKPWIFRPSYLIIGKAAYLTHLSSIQAYHLSRILLGIIFLFTVYKFICLFFKNRFERIFTYCFFLTSAGFGLLIVFFFKINDFRSIDVWVPEAFTFLMLKEAPHFIISQIVMILGFSSFMKGLQTQKKKYFIYTSLLFLFLFLEHPYNAPVVFLTLLLTVLWLKKNFREYLLTVTISSLGFAYLIPNIVFKTGQSSIIQSFYTQNITESPDYIMYIFGFGLILLFALFGINILLKDKNPKNILILSWLAATAVLVYSPLNFQRRMIEGINIPLTIAASLGIFYLLPHIKKFFNPKFRATGNYVVLGVIILLSSVTNIGTNVNEVKLFNQDSESNYYYNILDSEKTTMDWLRVNTNSNDIILSNIFYGNLIPGITGRKVFMGHNIQTPLLSEKISKVNWFLLDKNNDKTYEFLKRNHITYIFLGKYDSMIRYGFNPKERAYLQLVYSKDGVLIFKVK
ncbi:MAG: hypothetical protein M1268_03880 [Patescibacteria group bacterium]|nr:hypothetical protein [Patescibacteria group bacterium]